MNLSDLTLPTVLGDALHLISLSALPAALFSLGGVLYRYRPEGDATTPGETTTKCYYEVVFG